MAFTQFLNDQYVRVLESDTVTRLGYFKVSDATEMKHMLVGAFVRGIIADAFTFRINIYGSATSPTALYSSDWATLSISTLINNTTGLPYENNWLGNFYVDFDGAPLTAGTSYYLAAETSGYTRDGDDFYIGVNLDWYSEVNNQLDGPSRAGVRVWIVGKR